MNNDTRGTGRGPDKPAGHDQEAEAAEYQRQLDATSENGADQEEGSQSGEAAEWADRHPRAAGAVGESVDDPAASGSPDHLSTAVLGHAQLPQHERECQASSGAHV